MNNLQTLQQIGAITSISLSTINNWSDWENINYYSSYSSQKCLLCGLAAAMGYRLLSDWFKGVYITVWMSHVSSSMLLMGFKARKCWDIFKAPFSRYRSLIFRSLRKLLGSSWMWNVDDTDSVLNSNVMHSQSTSTLLIAAIFKTRHTRLLKHWCCINSLTVWWTVEQLNTHLWGCYAGLFIIQTLCVGLLSVAIPLFQKTFLGGS